MSYTLDSKDIDKIQQYTQDVHFNSGTCTPIFKIRILA